MAQIAGSPVKTDDRVEPLQRKFHGCSTIKEYELMGKLGEGTFGEVHKARSRRTGAIVALKKILMHNEKDGFPITALREIKLLKMLSHVNVLKLEEMAIERNKGEGRKKAVLYMVTPYMDHDLSGLLENPGVQFSEPQIKCYMLQLLEGLRYLHDSHILHRDMKAANLLINNKGILQIADFGLARHYDEPVPQPGRGNGEAKRDYTTLVVTRWYRPPELLLQLRRYTPAIDMWGVGCVFGEMFKRKPILGGTSDLNQAHIIFDLVGSPTEDNKPGWSQLPGCEGVKSFAARQGNLGVVFKDQSPEAIELLSELLRLDWRKRINAIDAIRHKYFRTAPLPARPEDIPWFEDSHELDRRKFREKKSALPPAPAGGTVGMGADGHWTGSGPPNGGPWMNGYGNADRQRGGGHTQDRGPPGTVPPLPPRSHDNNRPPQAYHDPRGPPPPAGGPPPARRPAWQQRPPDGQHRPFVTEGYPSDTLPDGMRHPLPHSMGDGGRHHLPRPPNGAPRGPPNVDTYIPSYGPDDRPSRARDDRPPRDDRPRRGDRPPTRERDEGMPRDDRGRRGSRDYRDRDMPAERRLDYGRNDRRNTRSRSPDRDRRDRMQGRERELYRR
ncbi:hypothetical protein LTR04_007079 [Oleoguttula sp. CCFEE 6159]|nr:hypothetical protein LTR04_007079 [Oleoguttula sp. CCFEE 6159]